MSETKVTAAITTFDRARYLAGAVDSVLAQGLDDVELLVIDDGSTDDTADVAARYGDRLRYIRQENRGRAGSRNRALADARGEYVAFLDVDDLWLPGKLARQVAALDARPDAALVHGHVEVIDEHGAVQPRLTAQHRRLFDAAHRDGVTYAGYAESCLCFTSATLMRTETVRALGGYDESILVEDLDLYLRLALDAEIVFLGGDAVARYRVHSAQTPARERAVGELQVARKHLALLDTRRDVPEAARARRSLELLAGRSHRILGEAAEARRAALRAVTADPAALARPQVLRRVAGSLLPRRRPHSPAE